MAACPFVSISLVQIQGITLGHQKKLHQTCYSHFRTSAIGLLSTSLPLLYNASQSNGPNMNATFEFHVETSEVSRLQYLFDLIRYELRLKLSPKDQNRWRADGELPLNRWYSPL